MTAEDVVQGLQRLCAHRGAPRYVKSAHGPACSAQRVTTWRSPQPVKPHFIAPGSPGQNGHHESLNGVWRDGCRKRWLWTSVYETRRISINGREAYNHDRPHGALHGADTPGICSAIQRPMGREGCMSISNIETGRVTLGLTRPARSIWRLRNDYNTSRYSVCASKD